jgi:hypothetical protein
MCLEEERTNNLSKYCLENEPILRRAGKLSQALIKDVVLYVCDDDHIFRVSVLS